MNSPLFSPITIGDLALSNRVVMAPLTRMRAAEGDVPTELHAEYYRQRASAGLIIAEASQVSPQGKGYMQTPGIYNQAQVEGWQKVTKAVHDANGLIALQLWHVGRIGHDSLQEGGQPPVSASAIAARTRTTIRGEHGEPVRVNCSLPRALELDEIPAVIDDFKRATKLSRDAGFDMVEVHAAHGYLLQQFQALESNERTDQYGGSMENRARLTLEVVDAVIAEWSPSRVGVRLSPKGNANGLEPADGEAMVLYLAAELNKRGIAYVHLSEPDWFGGPAPSEGFREALRNSFEGVIIVAGGYTLEKANGLYEQNLIDAVAFGRPYISNPDLVERLKTGAPFNPERKELYYGGGAEGYTDYPAL